MGGKEEDVPFAAIRWTVAALPNSTEAVEKRVIGGGGALCFSVMAVETL
jgi:hypothetical protein